MEFDIFCVNKRQIDKCTKLALFKFQTKLHETNSIPLKFYTLLEGRDYLRICTIENIIRNNAGIMTNISEFL